MLEIQDPETAAVRALTGHLGIYDSAHTNDAVGRFRALRDGSPDPGLPVMLCQGLWHSGR